MARALFMALLGASILAGCGRAPTAPDSFAGRFDALWATFDRDYSYFELKGVDWDAARTRFASRAAAAATEDAFIAVIREMLGELRDVHVRLVSPSGQTIPTFTPSTVPNWDGALWQQVVIAAGWVQVKPNLGYATMRGIPYVAIGGWSDTQFSTADLDAVLERFRGAGAVIVDVRPNGGGSDRLAFDFAGRFTARDVVAEYVQYRDGPRHTDFSAETAHTVAPRGPWTFASPVVVLSGRGAYSSNESFIAAMRELSHVQIVGDTTGGGSGNPASYNLGNGWSYTVSRWIARTRDRQPIEGRGIAPAVYVAWDPAVRAQGRDPIIEAALAILGAPPPVATR